MPSMTNFPRYKILSANFKSRASPEFFYLSYVSDHKQARWFNVHTKENRLMQRLIINNLPLRVSFGEIVPSASLDRVYKCCCPCWPGRVCVIPSLHEATRERQETRHHDHNCDHDSRCMIYPLMNLIAHKTLGSQWILKSSDSLKSV